MRAIVTGPGDTPYSKGCFVFDIYFPATYPNNPPLVKLITTGNGTVRYCIYTYFIVFAIYFWYLCVVKYHMAGNFKMV